MNSKSWQFPPIVGFIFFLQVVNFVLVAMVLPIKFVPMIEENFKRLLTEVYEAFEQKAGESLPPRQLFKSQSALLADAFFQLDELRRSHPFDEEPQQVVFYKFVFPEFYALAFYARLKYRLVIKLPSGDLKGMRRHYKARLSATTDFFSKYNFYYDYYQSASSELDTVFFTGNDPFHVLQPVIGDDALHIAPPMSVLSGMFKAYERLNAELLAAMYQLEPKPLLSGTSVSEGGGLVSRFQWKGEVVNLIELGHGIYLSGQLEPSVGIVEFFKALGDFFGVNLRVPRRGFDDLKKRKKMSQTHFCELMASVLRQKMEDEDAYDPDKAARKNGFF